MKLLDVKKVKIPAFVFIILCIVIISASIFISRALYVENGIEIVPELKGSLKLVKFVNYENDGKDSSLLEFNFKEKIAYNNNYYSPVKDNSVYIQIPKIGDVLPSSVEVITISSKATNGKDIQREAESEYDKESGMLHIFDNNEGDEIYYGKSSDSDEYLVICYYENKLEVPNDEDKKINVPIAIQYQSLNKQIGLIEGEFEQEIALEEKGELICSEIKTGNVYNGYINSNISSGTKYETEFTQNVTMYVDYLDVDEITFEEVNAFKNENNEINISKNINTKKISINKSDVLRIFGDEGNLQLISESGDILLDVNKDTVEENNEVIFSLENISDNVFIKTSKPINKGLIRISVTKAISAEMVDLNNKYVVTGQKVIGKKTIEVDNEETPKEDETENIIESVCTDYTEIQEAITKVNISLDNKEWTKSVQNNVNFVATFVNSNEKYNLFKNPSLEVILPENVEKVVLGESYLLNANGLSIENIESIEKEDGKKAIVAKLQGVQTEYLFDNMIDGTKIVIPATIILEKEFESNTNNVTISYNNEVGNTNKNGSKQIAVSLISEIEQQNNDTTVNNEPIENIDLESAKLQNNQQDEKLKLAANVSKVQELKENGGLSINAVATVGENVIARAGTNETTNVQNGIAYERQVIKYEVTITNNTEETISDISVIGGIPSYTKYATIDHGTYWDMEITYDYITDESVTNYKLESISTLKPGETKIEYYEVLVDDLEDGLNNISTSNNITVKVSDEKYDTYILSNKISQAELDIKLKSAYNREGDDTFVYQINVTNLTDSDLNNIYVETSNIPKELTFDQSIVMYAENASGNGKIEDNKFKINIDSLESGATRIIWIAFDGENYDDKVNEVELKMSANAFINDVTYRSNENRITAYPQYVTATMTLDKEGQEVHYQDDLIYTVTIKNESKVKTLINILANLPEEINGVEAKFSRYDVGTNISTEYDIEAEANLEYTLVDEIINLSMKNEDDDDIDIKTILPAGKTLTLTIKAKAGYVNKDTEASNFITITGDSIKQVKSNVTTVRILTEVNWDYLSGQSDSDETYEQDENNEGEEQEKDNSANTENNSVDNNSNNKKFSISGLVWLDENADGRRTSDEKRITDVTAKIYNAENNSIVIIDNNKLISKVNENGEYIFNNIPNGRYYCLFEYDTENYEVTTYQKSGVASSLNNDATKTEVNMNGVVKNIAITDVLVVNNSNLINIDLGLVENTKFNLKLEKYISKVTVNDQEKNKEYTYDNTSLAKVEIASKYIEGAVVTIEYKFVVTNEGNITGYANEITDYLPEELSFSENSNNGWSLGKDGYLRNTALTAKPIAVGESKILTLILTKTMTKDSTGTIKNSAEITRSSNLKNLKEVDSKDNVDSAEIIISVKTGVYRNIIIIVIIMIVLLETTYLIKKYNKKIPTMFMAIVLMVLVGSNISYGYDYINIKYADSPTYINGEKYILFGGGYYWKCISSGMHQCGTGSHYYTVSEKTTVLTNGEWETNKVIELAPSSGDTQFRYFDDTYCLVGPYEFSCSIGRKNLKSYKITASLDGGKLSKKTVYDSKGNEKTWSSGKNFTFYLKVPKETKGVTQVKVTATVEKGQRKTESKQTTYTATCTSISSGDHQGEGGVTKTPSVKYTQNAQRYSYSNETVYKDSTAYCEFSAVYAGSIKILKKDAATGKSIAQNSGAEFTIVNIENGVAVRKGVKIGEVVYGLPLGVYEVRETKAPTGYSLELQENRDETYPVKYAELSKEKTTEVTFLNQKYTNLEIKKIDKSSKEPIEGIGFQIYDNNYKKYIDGGGWQTNTPVTIYTNSDGLIRINNVLLYMENSNFTVREADSKNPAYKVDTSVQATIKGKSNTTTTWSTTTIENSKAYGLTLSKKDKDNENETIDAKFVIKYENSQDKDNGKWITSSGTYSNTKSEISTSSGQVQLLGIKKGIYHIYETKITTPGYSLEWQDGYDEINKWVDLGTITVADQNVELSKTIYNERNIKIKGYVWQDNPATKENEYNNIYEEDVDSLLQDIEVELIDKSEGVETVVASTTTDENGAYEFSNLNKLTNNPKIIYWNLNKYYVRFKYDKEKYIIVEADLSSDKTNTSKAKEKEVTAEDLDDNKLIGQTGYAVTYPSATGETDGLGRYYNTGTCYVENINLGLIEKHDPQYSIAQELDYIKVELNGYTYTYNYGKAETKGKVPDGETEEYPFKSTRVPTTSAEDLSGHYTSQVYPSDVAYNKEHNGELKVYVVYKITVKNTENTSIDQLYKEQKLYLTSLTNSFDSERYELVNDKNNEDEHYEEFNKWKEVDNQGVASYNLENSVYTDGIGKGESVSTYIQFKVTNDALKNMLNNEYDEKEKVPTQVTAEAYHEYLRKDDVWNKNSAVKSYNGENVTGEDFLHRSVDKEVKSYALYIHLKLGDPRTVSGIVFKDENTREILEAKVGDGIYNNNENVVENVKVDLLNEDKTNLAERFIVDKEATGGYTKKTDSVYTDNEGYYSIDGLVPGYYYIRFTYGDGSQVIYDSNGNQVEENIRANDYKSTVINENIKDIIKKANENTDDDNAKWYRKIDNKYSVATDNLEKRGYDGRSYTKNDESNSLSEMDAHTPKTSIPIENDENTSTENGDSHNPTYENFNFGIMEQAKTIITLEKKITNINLTAQQGADLVSGNPTESKDVSNLDKNTVGGSKDVLLEKDLSTVYGSRLTATFEIKVKNESEYDYIENDNGNIGDYYNYGITQNTEPKTVKVEEILDIMSEKYKFDGGQAIDENEEIEFTNGENNTMTITGFKELSYGEEKTISYTVTSSISLTEDDLLFKNVAEVNKISLAKLTTLQTGFVWADDNTIFSIIPSTGDDRRNIYYIIAIVSLTILSSGIVIIKKKILKK